MHLAPPVDSRTLRTRVLETGLTVVGGGLAGVCAAITAARAGASVVLVQDRPVLGGNASSEVRLWVLGATSHLGNNNRWSREGGLIDELLVENLWRNPEGNPLLFDVLLLEKVRAEPNLTLLLNTAIHEVVKDGEAITAVRGFNAQDSTVYEIRSPLFCDASGDGVVGFLAGAAFRMGAEAKEEFDEGLAPDAAYGELLGHTIYFYSKDAGRPVTFVPPAFALQDITAIPRWKNIKAGDMGSRFWWLEYGGRHDTVHDTEAIKWELWKVVYGVWNHIKNSGQFPEAANLTLEWVGTVPGKRESRRFEGPVILTQRDVVEARTWDDAVAFGGWSLDLHPADGVYSARPGCNQFHARRPYQIPYRCLFSRNIPNLFLAGRIISVSHVAFSSTRVMATCAHGGQAVGMAAARCLREGLRPADLLAAPRMAALQADLLRSGQHLPGLCYRDAEDLVTQGRLTASSTLRLARLEADDGRESLDTPRGQWLPLAVGPVPRITVRIDAPEGGDLRIELRAGTSPDDFTPSVILASTTRRLAPGLDQAVEIDLAFVNDVPRYGLLALFGTPGMAVQTTAQRITGLVSVARKGEKAVSSTGAQVGPPGSGVESFEFWTPSRRPAGRNLALAFQPALNAFAVEQVRDGIDRPTDAVHAWVADPADPAPTLTVAWDTPRTLHRIDLGFDADYDHPLESVLMGHPERMMPFTVATWNLRTADGTLVAEGRDQHLSRVSIILPTPVTTDHLILTCGPTHGGAPASVFLLRAW